MENSQTQTISYGVVTIKLDVVIYSAPAQRENARLSVKGLGFDPLAAVSKFG